MSPISHPPISHPVIGLWNQCIVPKILQTFSVSVFLIVVLSGCNSVISNSRFDDTIVACRDLESRNQIRDWITVSSNSVDEASAYPTVLTKAIRSQTPILVEIEKNKVVAMEWGSGFEHYGIALSLDKTKIPTHTFLEFLEIDKDMIVYRTE